MKIKLFNKIINDEDKPKKTHLSWTEKFKLSLQKEKDNFKNSIQKTKDFFCNPKKFFKDYKENVLKPEWKGFVEGFKFENWPIVQAIKRLKNPKNNIKIKEEKIKIVRWNFTENKDEDQTNDK